VSKEVYICYDYCRRLARKEKQGENPRKNPRKQPKMHKNKKAKKFKLSHTVCSCTRSISNFETGFGGEWRRRAGWRSRGGRGGAAVGVDSADRGHACLQPCEAGCRSRRAPRAASRAPAMDSVLDQADLRRVGAGTPPPDGCTSCYIYGVICALVGASLQAVGLQVRCPA
jgi:hypothetical protein